jgi:hypothetical protein
VEEVQQVISTLLNDHHKTLAGKIRVSLKDGDALEHGVERFKFFIKGINEVSATNCGDICLGQK